MNKVYYDGVQLIRDDGESYVYDGEGNLSGAKDAAENPVSVTTNEEISPGLEK